MLRHFIFPALAVVCSGLGTVLFAAMPSNYDGHSYSGDPIKGKPIELPGMVKAVYFDEGGEGVGFHDNDAGHTGDPSMRVNADGQKITADDPVDMQKFSPNFDYVAGSGPAVADTMKGTFHLSWLEAMSAGQGEWYNYTVHVKTAGIYSMDFHWAVAIENGITSVGFSGMKPDSQINPPVCIRPSGDVEVYHDWRWDNAISTFTLDTGLYVVTLKFLKGNWNFDCMVFNLKSTRAVDPETQIHSGQKGLDVKSFVNGTEVEFSYSLNQAGPVTVSVFDCAGRSTIPDIIRNMSTGPHPQAVRLGAMSTGVHFVRVESNGHCEVKYFTIAR
jgi:hypothetical protein